MASKKSFRETFDEISLRVVQFLENHDGVNHLQFHERDGVSKDAMRRWETTNQPLTLPNDYKGFLHISNGVSLRWNFQLGDRDVPLGCIHLNELESVKKVDMHLSDPIEELDSRLQDAVAFDIDNTCKDGKICFVYISGQNDPQIWFQDLCGRWFFVCNTFTEYFRLMILHLGLPRWQYAFTDIGLDPISQVSSHPFTLSISFLAAFQPHSSVHR
eukprot:TRINITY_DN9980_c0_g1_i3.p1 TRINITY_DN9980_c0_g1~~TRINITY_DN9980_c0_g1_i3.p1  ORF type:complete len:215 (+),score=44.70 TRINITY_DN9980_c0_g1_i3:44-688(+)